MKTKAIILLFSSAIFFSFSSAQRNYFGVGLSVYTNFVSELGAPSLQIGTIGEDGSELRASLDTLIFVNMLSSDLLYTQYIPENDLRFYLGGGFDLVIIAIPNLGAGIGILAGHATAGLEFVDGNLGYYVELQPILGINGVIYGRMRFGLNIGF